MFLRYAHSPSCLPGWAIGVQLVVETTVGSQDEQIKEAFVYTKALTTDAYVKAGELGSVVSTNITPAEMTQEDLAEFSRTIAKVSISPGTYPWASMDGALSSLAVDAGDTSMTAEWNTEHSESWKGLNELHSMLELFYKTYN
tara:strand:- start:12539 stop:12964 length:426 start_codon:yes stop_codon:yes gene_type:complete